MNIPNVEDLERVRDLLEEIGVLLDEVKVPTVESLEEVVTALQEIKQLQEE